MRRPKDDTKVDLEGSAPHSTCIDHSKSMLSVDPISHKDFALQGYILST